MPRSFILHRTNCDILSLKRRVPTFAQDCTDAYHQALELDDVVVGAQTFGGSCRNSCRVDATSGHHISLEHRVRKKHLELNSAAAAASSEIDLEEKKKKKKEEPFLREKNKEWKNMKAGTPLSGPFRTLFTEALKSNFPKGTHLSVFSTFPKRRNK